MSKPMVAVEVDSINIYPGQTITIWMNGFHQHENKREAVQVELRVVPGKHGKHEIYISDKFTGAEVHHGFDDWYSMGRKPRLAKTGGEE